MTSRKERNGVWIDSTKKFSSKGLKDSDSSDGSIRPNQHAKIIGEEKELR